MVRNKSVGVSFYDSMKRSPLFNVDFANKNKDWQQVKILYEKNYLAKIDKEENNYQIPKKIHQIWLGGDIPEEYDGWRKSWKVTHPDWEYKLWTDEDAKKFKMVNRDAFDLVDNLGSKSDIFRLEILYKYGGIYVDTDFECLKPFDQICKMTSFFAGIAYSRSPEMCNALIGSSKTNPIIEAYMMRIKKAFGDGKKYLNSNEVMERTGPYSFAKTYHEYVRKNDIDSIPFPVTFFYCFPNNERFKRSDKKVVRSYINPESFAVHYWSTSWVKEMSLIDRLKNLLRRMICGA
jgi:inositol phosphorylceramide mannosyltransferase catalytic subunit